MLQGVDPHAEEVVDQLDLIRDRKGTFDKVIQKSVNAKHDDGGDAGVSKQTNRWSGQNARSQITGNGFGALRLHLI
jgi:hypothetical protein